MQDSPEHPFWNDLRQRSADADGYEPLSDADVEQILAECGEESLSENEIDTIVAAATNVGPRPVVAGEDGLDRARRASDPVPQRRHVLKAAAVVAGATFLLVAGVVWTRHTWWGEGNPTKDVPYATFIRALVDTRNEGAVRRVAGGNLLGWLNKSTKALQSVKTEPLLRPLATMRLEQLHALATGDRGLEPKDMDEIDDLGEMETIDKLVASVESVTLSAEDRRQYIDQLWKQMRLGVLALKTVAAEKPPSTLSQSCEIRLVRLEQRFR